MVNALGAARSLIAVNDRPLMNMFVDYIREHDGQFPSEWVKDPTTVFTRLVEEEVAATSR
jgi:hypothetical protein